MQKRHHNNRTEEKRQWKKKLKLLFKNLKTSKWICESCLCWAGLPRHRLVRLFMLYVTKWIRNICLRTSMSATTTKHYLCTVDSPFYFIYNNIPWHLNPTQTHATHFHMQFFFFFKVSLNTWFTFHLLVMRSFAFPFENDCSNVF